MTKVPHQSQRLPAWWLCQAAVVLLIGLFPMEAAAQRSAEGTELTAEQVRSVEQYQKQAKSLAQHKAYAGALEQLQQALRLVEGSGGRLHPQAAILRGEMANVHSQRGDLGTAAALYKEAIELSGKSLGFGHGNLAALYNDFGGVLLKQKRFAEAQAQHEKALAIQRAVLEEDDLEVAVTLNDLSAVHAAQSNLKLALALGAQVTRLLQKHRQEADRAEYDQAEEVARNLLTLTEQATEAQNAALLEQSRRHLAKVYQIRQQPGKAVPLLAQVLDVKEDVLGEAHPEVIKLMVDIGRLSQANGEYERAEGILLKAVAILRREHGAGGVELVPALLVLASLYVEQERYTSAELLYKQVLLIKKATLGEAHPEVAAILIQLADLYAGQGNQVAAEEHYERAIAILVGVYGEEHEEVADAVVKLAQFLSEYGNLRQASTLYGRAIRIKEALLGPDHAEVADVMELQADVEMAMKHLMTARALYQRVMDIRIAVFGEESSEVIESLVVLGEAHQALGELGLAEEAYGRALRIDERLSGPDHPGLAAHMVRMAQLQAILENDQEAQKLYQEAIRLKELELKASKAKPSEVLLALSTLYEELGELTESETLLGKAHDVKRDVLGAKHPDVQRLAQKLSVPIRSHGHRLPDAAESHGDSARERMTTIEPWQLRAENGEAPVGTQGNEISLSMSRPGRVRRSGESGGVGSSQEQSEGSSERGRSMTDMAKSLSNRAETFAGLGQYAEAESLYMDSLQLYERSGDRIDPSYLDVLQAYSQMLRAVGRTKEANALEYRARTTTIAVPETEETDAAFQEQPFEVVP